VRAAVNCDMIETFVCFVVPAFSVTKQQAPC